MKEFRVDVKLTPVWCVVEAKDKDEAIDKAIKQDKWNFDSDYCKADYIAKEVKPERKKK